MFHSATRSAPLDTTVLGVIVTRVQVANTNRQRINISATLAAQDDTGRQVEAHPTVTVSR